MDLQSAFTLKLILQDFPPKSFSHVDIHEKLMEPSGIYRSMLLFGSFMAPKMKITKKNAYDKLVSNGDVRSDDQIV